MPVPKGQRYGGRRAGTKNKATIAREEAARAQIAESLKKARAAGVTPRIALDELYKVTQVAESFAAKLQPKSIEQDGNGRLAISGGDMKSFGEWYDRLFRCIELMIKYQLPTMRPIESPAPAPDPADVENASRKRFELRVFDGGRAVEPMTRQSDDEDE